MATVTNKTRQSRRGTMKKTWIAAGAAVTLAAGPAMAQDKTVKIGFISTFSGPVAAIGNDMKNSFELALDQHGRKLGGLPVEVIYADDQLKPEVGVQKTQELIESNHVDFMVGYIWSNVMLASLKPLVDSKTMTVITNAGASQLAGDQCSPYVFSTSFQNDQVPAAVGTYMNEKGIKTVFLIAPNYTAGKDMITGFKSTFKGQVVGEELPPWPTQLDFSAELSKVRAAKPDALYVFYPGGPGIQFVTQYAQSGLKGQVPLYSGFTIDDLSLPRLKDLAVGNPSAMLWVSDLPNDTNKKFVADFKAKYKTMPLFYGADTYDSVALIDDAVTAVKGDLTNKEGMRKEMEKADFKSVKGNFKFGNNHLPIQNFYLEEARKDDDGSYSLHTISTIVKDDQDAYHAQCPMK